MSCQGSVCSLRLYLGYCISTQDSGALTQARLLPLVPEQTVRPSWGVDVPWLQIL